MKKNIVAGLGEIGLPILQLISKNTNAVGYDIDDNLIDKKKFSKYQSYQTEILHICIPFSKNFISDVISLTHKFNPELVAIHSTVSPLTTGKLQKKIPIPVIYSATRGVHRRMLKDLKRYTKFFAIEPDAPHAKWAIRKFSKLMNDSGIKTEKMSSPVTLELAKIVVDTTYYGWLINYAQLSNIIAKKYRVDYDEMWKFSDEIQQFLGNRPKMYPGFIGGHCVIPNLSLIDENKLDQIKQINDLYLKKFHKKNNTKKINSKKKN